MAQLQIRWMLEIEGFSERGEDEVAIQFALVTVFGETAHVEGHRVTNLFPDGGFAPLASEIDEDGRRIRASGTVTRLRVPTTENPFLGFVARGIEEDASLNREDDDQRFFNAVEASAQAAVDAGGFPTSADLWTAGHNAELEDLGWWLFDWDDDDRVSTSVRTFPAFGSELNVALAAEPETPPGGVELPGPEESFLATYVGEGQSAGALWQMRVWISLVTNGAEPDTQQWGW